MTAHTPGPWQRSGVRQKLGDHDCIRVGPDGFAIAFLPIGRRPQEQAGALADANLIAAAPSLLTACEGLLDALDEDCRDTDEWERLMMAARHAIMYARDEAELDPFAQMRPKPSSSTLTP